MSEKMPPEEQEKEPRVPVPEDFPEDVKISHPPGLDTEEQRRKYEEDTGVIKKRHGGGLSDSKPIS